MRIHALVATAAMAWLAVPLAGDEPKPGNDVRKRDRDVRATIDLPIDGVTLYGDGKEPLTSLALHGFGNLERDVDGRGALVLWIEGGRPAATASVFRWRGQLVHELACIGRKPVAARRDGVVVWSPKTSSVEFSDVPKAPVPAEDAAGRLAQMKEMAAGLEATMLGWRGDNADRQQLVLLRDPLYRYESKDKKLLDGALFAFVLGNDPEALVLLEAVIADEKPRWQFGFARATSAALAAKSGEDVIWSVGKLMGPDDPLKPNIALLKPLPLP